MPVPEPNYAQQAQLCQDELFSLRMKAHEVDGIDEERRKANERADKIESLYLELKVTSEREVGAARSDLSQAKRQVELLNRKAHYLQSQVDELAVKLDQALKTIAMFKSAIGT